MRDVGDSPKSADRVVRSTRLAATAVARRWLLLPGIACGLTACSQPTAGPDGRKPGPALAFMVTRPVRPSSAGTGTVYVSLPPGQEPRGVRAKIENRQAGFSATTPVSEGGFDPVGVTAAAGDTILITVTRSDSSTVSNPVAVPAFNRPVVVRTSPPPLKRDVPLNAVIVVVFSEPVDSIATVGGISLKRGGAIVPGAVVVDGAQPWIATFVPREFLTPQAAHELTIAATVRGLGGTPMDSSVVVRFTTGGTTTAVTDFRISEDSLQLDVGEQRGLRATATDSGVTVVVAATWTSSNPSVATVTPEGIVTGISAGRTSVSASAGSRVRSIPVTVRSAPVSISFAPDSVEVMPGWGTDLERIRYLGSDGKPVLFQGALTWVSSDSSVAVPFGEPGAILGGRAGTATLTARVPGSGATASVRVVVRPRSGVLTILAVAPDGRSTRLIDVALDGSTPQGWAAGPVGAQTIHWSPTGQLLADCGVLRVCTLDPSGAPTDLGVPGAVRFPAWHPDGRRVVFTDSAGGGQVFDPATRAVKPVGVPGPSHAVRISPDTGIVAYEYDRLQGGIDHTGGAYYPFSVYLWDHGTPREAAEGFQCQEPAWAPTAPALVMTCYEDGISRANLPEQWVFAMGGDAATTIARLPYHHKVNGARFALPQWQPAGDVVAFLEVGHPAFTRIYVGRPDLSRDASPGPVWLSFADYRNGLLDGYTPLSITWRR